LRKQVEVLELENVEVVTGRLEVLIESDPGALACDGFTSRATLKLGPTLAMAASILRPGGHAILWKGSGLSEEIRTAERPALEPWNQVSVAPIGDGPNSIAVF